MSRRLQRPRLATPIPAITALCLTLSVVATAAIDGASSAAAPGRTPVATELVRQSQLTTTSALNHARRPARGLRVVVIAPPGAGSQAKVVVRGPRKGKAFNRTVSRTTTWRKAPSGRYQIKAGAIRMYDQTLTPKLSATTVRLNKKRILRTVTVRYPAAVFCATNGSRLRAWGDNSHGQLGRQGQALSAVPVVNPWLRGVTAVAGGASSTYALCGDGTVWAWGNNSAGQLGVGDRRARVWPVRVAGLTKVVEVVAGVDTAYARRSDGTVWAWGNGRYGQLGDGTSGYGRQSLVPVRVQVPASRQIVAGRYTAYSLGRDVATVRAWGQGGSGQMGNGTTTVENATPVTVVTASDIVQIAAGDVTGYARRSGGQVIGWGSNNQGQIAGASGAAVLLPVLVASSNSALWAGGSTAYRVMMAQTDSWGSGRYRNTGRDSGGAPLGIGNLGGSISLLGIVRVAAAGNSGYALYDNGNVAAWGDHQRGQVGDGSPLTGPSHTTGGLLPRIISSLGGVTAIGAGPTNGYAISPF